MTKRSLALQNIASDEQQPVFVFDPSQISESQKTALAAAAMKGIRELFNRPGEEERFQEWLKNNGLTETPVKL